MKSLTRLFVVLAAALSLSLVPMGDQTAAANPPQSITLCLILDCPNSDEQVSLCRTGPNLNAARGLARAAAMQMCAQGE